MPDDQLAAAMSGRQHNRQSAKHAVYLFGVPMRKEKAPFFVDEQLVEFGRHIHTATSQSIGYGRKDVFECALPRFALDTDIGWRQLPGIAHRSVQYRFIAAAIRSAV